MTPLAIDILIIGLLALALVVAVATRYRHSSEEALAVQRWIDDPAYVALGTVSSEWLSSCCRRHREP